MLNLLLQAKRTYVFAKGGEKDRYIKEMERAI